MTFPPASFRFLSCSLLLLTASLSFGAEEGIRSCSVKEVLKGGIYVYVRCQEKDREIWLATVAREFKPDEVISFVNAPPMTDFFSKHLNRSFPEVIFTDLLPPGAQNKQP